MTDEQKQIMSNVVDIIKEELSEMCSTDNLSELETIALLVHARVEWIRALRAKADFNVEGDGYDECNKC